MCSLIQSCSSSTILKLLHTLKRGIRSLKYCSNGRMMLSAFITWSVAVPSDAFKTSVPPPLFKRAQTFLLISPCFFLLILYSFLLVSFPLLSFFIDLFLSLTGSCRKISTLSTFSDMSNKLCQQNCILIRYRHKIPFQELVNIYEDLYNTSQFEHIRYYFMRNMNYIESLYTHISIAFRYYFCVNGTGAPKEENKNV